MIRHMVGIAEIVENVEAAARYYRDVLGLTVEYEPGSHYATIKLPGILHFGLWDRRAAAESVFGDASAADRIPLGFSPEFEVDSVVETAASITASGGKVEQPPKTEPWGQASTRSFSVSGALIGFAQTPWARTLTHDVQPEPPNDSQPEAAT